MSWLTFAKHLKGHERGDPLLPLETNLIPSDFDLIAGADLEHVGTNQDDS
jgi:hypothetical protein